MGDFRIGAAAHLRRCGEGQPGFRVVEVEVAPFLVADGADLAEFGSAAVDFPFETPLDQSGCCSTLIRRAVVLTGWKVSRLY